MKKHLRNTLLVLGCACVVFAAVTTDYSRSADWSKYKTYSWIKVSVENPLWEDRVTHAVHSQLAAKGWTKVDTGGDAAVAAYAGEFYFVLQGLYNSRLDRF